MRVVRLLEAAMVHDAIPNKPAKEQVLDRGLGRKIKPEDRGKPEGKDREKKRKEDKRLKDLPIDLTVIHVSAPVRRGGLTIKVADGVAAHLVAEGVAEYA